MMKRNWLYILLFLVGCGSEPPLSPQELCEGMQQSHCARLYQCATTPELQAAFKQMFTDQEHCVTQGINKQMPVCSLWTEALACGRFGSAWNGAAARTCLRDLTDQSCAKALTGTIPGSCTPTDFCL